MKAKIMIDRYTLKVDPATRRAQNFKSLDEIKEYGREEMNKLQFLKVRVEAACEAEDFKKVTDLSNDLAKKPVA